MRYRSSRPSTDGDLPSSLRLEAAVFRSDAVVERSLDGLEDRSFRSLSVRGRFARVSASRWVITTF
jgi:hypothetical protein